MDKFVINIGRQIGSGGKIIGEIIARRLGIRLYDKELINLAARESGLCPECFEKADEREAKGMFATLIGYFRAPFTGYEGGNTNNILANESLFRIQSDVIRQIAARESAIFVGRCADYILRDHPRCVNVFITADEADRIDRLCKRDNCTPDEARAMMERIAAQRASFYNYYSLRTWGQAATYHLCVNSSKLGEEQTADFILDFAGRKLHEKF